MKSWTIGKRLVVGFGVVLFVSAAVGAYTVMRLSAIEKSAINIRDEAVSGLIDFSEIRGVALKSVADTLQMALSEDPAELGRLQKDLDALTEVNDKLYASYEKTIFEDADRRLFDTAKKTRAANGAARKEFLDFARTHTADQSAAEFQRVVAGPQAAYLKAIDESTDFNKQISLDDSTEITKDVSLARTWTMLGVFMAIGLGVVIAFLIVRSTNSVLGNAVSTLTEGARQLVSAAGQVSTSSQALSQGATEQAASLEETSASMEEMASMTRQNAENSQSAAALMNEVDTKVAGSNQALGDMVTSMASIRESSQQVAKIIKTIDEIAFQTNILALNAAVEAARAGEAGMGFAVVADEVRNLAQRSAQAARDTASLIEESIAKTERGNAKVEQVATAIAAITDSVGRVKNLVDGVSVASRQQSQGIDQVSQAVSQMEKVTQTTAATAEESAAASEELNAQAEGVMEVVSRIDRLVSSHAAVAGAPAQTTQAQAAKASGRLLRMASAIRPGRSAEDELPMDDTGTFGKF